VGYVAIGAEDGSGIDVNTANVSDIQTRADYRLGIDAHFHKHLAPFISQVGDELEGDAENH